MRSRSLLLYALCCCLFGFIGHAAQAEEHYTTSGKVGDSEDVHTSNMKRYVIDTEDKRSDKIRHPKRETDRDPRDSVYSNLYDDLGINRSCRNAKQPTCENGLAPEKINTGFCFRYVCPRGTPDACPSVAQPICKAGSKLVSSVDSKGCPRATCQKTDVSCMQILCKEGTTPVNTGKTNSVGCPIMTCEAKTCPTYNRPLCEGGDVVMVKDKFGCERPTCAKTDACPTYNRPLCEGGDIVMDKDKYGCDRPICVKTDTCPTYNTPLCDGGDVVTVKDKYGCDRPTCAKTDTCPTYNTPLCDGGKVVVEKDKYGCSRPTCAKTDVSCMQVLCKEGATPVNTGKTNSAGCPIMACKETKPSTSCAQVICKKGTTRVATGTNSVGCTTYTCKETTTSTSCAQVICKEGSSRVYVGKNNVGCAVYKCAPASASSLVR